MRLPFFSLIVLLSRGLAAQSSSAAWHPTVIGGLNIATLSPASSAPDGIRRGAFVGIGAIKALNHSWSFQPEVAFSMKGTDVLRDGLPSTISLTYLELPLLLRYTVPTSWRVRPFFLGGPQGALRTSCSIDSRRADEAFSRHTECNQGISIITENGPTRQLTADDYRPFDIDAVVGAGVALAVGTNTMTLSTRYEHGLMDVLPSTRGANSVVSLLVGFDFGAHR